MASRWWKRRRFERAALLIDDESPDGGDGEPQGRLDGAGPHGSPSQLSPRLRHVAQQAGILRLVIDTPLRRARDPLVGELPWVRRAYCDEYDLAVGDARKALWEWLREVERLPPADRRQLLELGLSARPFRRLLFSRLDRTSDTWEEVVWAEAPRLDEAVVFLREVVNELARFETVVLNARAHPYRAAS